MAATIETPVATSISTTAQLADPQRCTSCGSRLPPQDNGQAQSRIDGLESQVKLLSEKATAAIDKCADYEDEILRLRAMNKSSAVPSPPPSATFQATHQQALQPPPSPSIYRSSFSRISALLTRKSVPNLTAPAQSVPVFKPPPAPTQAPQLQPSPPDTTRAVSPNASSECSGRPPSQEVIDALSNAADLAAALAREQSLRRKAERNFEAASREVEELSVSLFEQANEMVAAERRARAKLEERVEVLEKRDIEKGRRLDRLEAALNKIQKARGVLEAKKVP